MENTPTQGSVTNAFQSASREKYWSDSREKYWSELTSDEKVERLRKELKRQCSKNEELMGMLYTLKHKFERHSHDKFERVLVPEALVKDDKGGIGYNKLTDKGGDEVYI